MSTGTAALATALAAHAAGLSVLPAHPTEKRPRSDWKRFQSEQTPVEQLRIELADRLGLVTGFNDVEALDFDLAGFACAAWKAAVEARAPGLVGKLYVESTPSGGRHVVYRCAEIAGNSKLTTFRLQADEIGEHAVKRLGKQMVYTVSEDAAGLRTVQVGTSKPVQAKLDRAGRWVAEICSIETRGIGGWLIVAPSPGYVAERGSLAELPEITAVEREVLMDAARSLSDAEPVADSPQRDERKPVLEQSDERPGDLYNRTGDHGGLLIRHGWTYDHNEGLNEHWTRPGKDSGTSATWHTGKRVFYAFSSNVAGIEQEKPYSLFTLRAALEHNDDLSACARAIRSEHVVDGAKTDNRTSANDEKHESRAVPMPGLGILDLLKLNPENDVDALLGRRRWLCRGMLAMLYGESGLGKSSLIMKCGIAWTLGRMVFDIHCHRPMRVLLVQAENDPHDLNEMVTGALADMGIDAEADLQRLHENFRIVSEPGVCGPAKVQDFIDPMLEGFKPDLLILDPLFAFLGGDASDQETASTFGRNMLMPLAKHHNVLVLMTHHTNKPQKDRPATFAGSQEWSNLCRAMLGFTAEGDDGAVLHLGKRGSRMGWADDAGRPSFKRSLKRSVGRIAWVDAGAAAEVAHADGADVDALIAFVASHPGRHTARSLKDKLGVGGSKLDRLISEARGAGWMDPATYVLTPHGQRQADDLLVGEESVPADRDSDPTGTDTGTPGRPDRDRAGHAENTKRPAGTETGTPGVCPGVPLSLRRADRDTGTEIEAWEGRVPSELAPQWSNDSESEQTPELVTCPAGGL